MLEVRLLLSDEGARISPTVRPKYPIPDPLGCVVATEAAMVLLHNSGANVNEILYSHQTLNMHVGDIGAHERREGMERARFLSSYRIGEDEDTAHQLWVLTDADRNLTMLLLPSEYRRTQPNSRE